MGFLRAASVVALAALSACGGAEPAARSNKSPTFRPPPYTADPQASQSEHPEGEDHTDEPSASPKPFTDRHGHETEYNPSKPPAADFRDPDVDGGGHGTLKLKVRIAPSCVEPGQRLTITLKSKPDVQVAFVTNVGTRDGKSEMIDGRTGADGLWSYSFVIPANQQPHQYDVLASAADDKGYDGGHTGTWHYVIAARGAC